MTASELHSRIGTRLRVLRKRRGLAIWQAAADLGWAPASLQAAETGNYTYPVWRLHQAAGYYGVTLTTLTT